MIFSDPCMFCGELDEQVTLVELWLEDRAFTIDTCCEASYGLWLDEMGAWSRRQWQAFIGEGAGVDVRAVGTSEADGPNMVLDYGLELAGSTTAKDKRTRSARGEFVREVTRDEAREFVRRFHRHSPKPPAGWRWGHAVWNGDDLIAIAMVGRPVARMTDPAKVVEVSRICVRDDIPACLAWNACSMLYGAAAREAKRRGFDRIQTFTIAEEEDGTSLKAAGWEVDRINDGGSWDRADRSRSSGNSEAPKARWRKLLNKRARREAQKEAA